MSLTDKDMEDLRDYWVSLGCMRQDYVDALLADKIKRDYFMKNNPFRFIDVEEEDGNN